jgi:hypothetical protein
LSVAIEDDKSEISVDQGESVRLKAKILALAVGVIFVAANAAGQQFQLIEASVSDIRRATQSGKLTCHSLVQQYLDRIEAHAWARLRCTSWRWLE